MKLLQLPLLCTLIVSTVLTPVTAQQKRRNPDKIPAKSPAVPAPAPPTFENLITADSFKVYVEVRNVGQLAKSSAVNDVLEPILKLGGPQQDFVDFVEWLKSHADQLTTSRMLIAAWPNLKDAPEFVAAIEFSSADEAAKFEKPLDGLLPTMFPPTQPASPATEKKSPPQQATVEQKSPAPVPGYALQRADSLLIVSPAPLQLKKLRPTGSKPLSEEPNFRVAYNRFASDPIFVFIDFKALEKEQEEQRKQWEEENKRAAEAAKKRKEEEQKENAEVSPDTNTSSEIQIHEKFVGVTVRPADAQPDETPDETRETKESSQAQPASVALSSVASALFGYSVPVMPDALGVGFSPDNDSFDLRALMLDGAGKTSDPVPFVSWIKFGGPIAPQSPTVIPVDSELVLTMSLDFQQLCARISAPMPPFLRGSASENIATEPTAPVTQLEKLLKIKIKDDLLPLIGPEVAVSLPLAEYNPFAPPRVAVMAQAKNEAKEDSSTNGPNFFVVISLRDKEGMHKLLPKIVEGFAGSAAAALAQTERRENTELVSYANMFAYAFVGDFLVFSTNAATTRHVVDSYLKGATLAADMQFKNYTRWLPHEVQGEVYVSSAFMKGYESWANDPNVRITDEARSFFAHFTAAAQPITYALSNDGLGTLHELHIPKNVLLLAIGGTAAAANPPPTLANERTAMSDLWTISTIEETYKEKNSSYGSLEELTAAKMVDPHLFENPNYKFELSITADGYSVSAVPIEYGKTGKLSFYLDQTGVVRGGDHAGAAASAADPIANFR